MNAPLRGRAAVLAPCKVNPTLVVIERRADGFHELDTTLLALARCDRVEVALADEAGFALDGPQRSDDIPSGERNLALRAARAALELARADGRLPAGCEPRVALTKEIPSLAGLGGGSSDAAAAALGMCRAAGLAPDDPRLAAALAELGSDCAFFLAARASGHARGKGRGERIEALEPPRAALWVAVITPRVPAATAAVYAALGELGPAAPRRERGRAAAERWARAAGADGARPAQRAEPVDPIDIGDIGELRAALTNDLEPAALRAFPELAFWRELLDGAGADHFRLAGSGASFFGLFAAEAEARAALDAATGAARRRGLAWRSAFAAPPARHGARPAD